MKERHLADLARTILNDPSVRVTFGGDTSYFSHDTDKSGNKTIHINIAKMEATPTGILLMCGLVFHEIGHVHTDGDKSPGMLGDFENIIEDVRTELLTIKARPGAAFDLEAVINHYTEKGSLEPIDLPTALLGKAMAYGRGRYLNQKVMLPVEEACNEMMEDAFGQSFIDEVEAILQGYSSLKDTDGSRAMAKAMIELLVQQQQQQQNQQQNQQSQSQSQQQQQGGNGSQEEDSQDSDQGNSQDDQDGQDGNGQSQQQGDGQGQEQQQDANSTSGGQGGNRPTPEEIEEMLANQTGFGDLGQLMQDELDELADKSRSSKGYSEIEIEIPEWPELGKLTRKYNPLDEAEAMCASSRMRTRLGGLLFAAKRLPVSHGTSGRKLNTNKLVRMMTAGDPKIFQKKVEEAAPNSAVAIIVDTSGSMDSSNRWVIANKAAYALNSCLHSLTGVKCATLEFSNKDRNDGSFADVNIVCDFGRKPKSDSFNIPPFKGTPTDQAIWAARGLLLQRPEPRKILLIVTDGDPNDYHTTLGATRRTMRDGIEIAAIGIQSSAVENFWKNNRVINDLSDLPTAMFGMMEDLLTRRPGGDL